MSVSTSLAWSVFELGFRPWMASRVRVHLTGVPQALPPAGRILLVANHESFWDGFLLRAVQRRIRPGASFHAVMLDRELEPRPLLRLLGGVGVTPGSLASGRRLLRRVAELDADAVLAYFPQGTLRPGSPRPLGFQPGVARVARALEAAAVVPVGIRVLSGRTVRSEAYLSLGDHVLSRPPRDVDASLLEAAVAEQLDAIESFVSVHGEDAPVVWPGPEGRLAPGRSLASSTIDASPWPQRN